MTDSPFSPTALQRHVDTALASIPPHHRHALIVRADGSSIGGAIAIRAGDTWTVGGEVVYDFAKRSAEGGIAIKGSW